MPSVEVWFIPFIYYLYIIGVSEGVLKKLPDNRYARMTATGDNKLQVTMAA